MNILSREGLHEYSVKRTGENFERFNNFSDIRRFLSVGFSTIYTATSEVDGRNGIKSGDKVYFKINNQLGVNKLGRIDESSGSCEDVAEVMGYYALRNLQKSLGKDSVLRTTPYDFADYENDAFFDVISHKTSDFVEDDRLYGCISKNCISSTGDIIHGDALLSLVVDDDEVYSSRSNTIYNYDKALEEFSKGSASRGCELVVDPITTRYVANTMFWDYFFANSDRHCKNVNFEKIPLGDGKFLVTPLAIIDNGGGLCMQSNNCKDFFEHCSSEGLGDGFYRTYSGSSLSPFSVPYELSIGREAYPDGDFKDVYDELKVKEQIVVLLSCNRTLYNDFANMYKNLDFEKAIQDMRTELTFNSAFLPNLPQVSAEILNLKKAEVSESIADFMGEVFDFNTFLQNPNYYVDKMESFVEEDSLNLHIATNEEVEEFNGFMSKTYPTIILPSQLTQEVPEDEETTQEDTPLDFDSNQDPNFNNNTQFSKLQGTIPPSQESGPSEDITM